MTGPMSQDETEVPEVARPDLRETYRKQLLASIGGWTGSLITAIPPIVFVIVNSTAGLRAAIISAVGTGVLLVLYRLVRRQPLQQAITGLFGVAIAAFIAARTGQARGYFLLGIWSSFLYAGVFVASMLIRRPIVGVLWEFLDPSPPVEDDAPWYRRPALLRGYLLATLIGTALFASRGIVQLTLYKHNATGWLAFARIAMGFPLYLVALGGVFLVVSRTRRRLAPAG
jgi:uncharacterized protein DUF3159